MEYYLYFNCYFNSFASLLPVILILASQRIETLIFNWLGEDVATNERTPTKRGAAPTAIEWYVHTVHFLIKNKQTPFRSRAKVRQCFKARLKFDLEVR